MKIYITYDWADYEEEYVLYNLTNDLKNSAIKLAEDLFDFISYGPDDCHSFQMQSVNVKKETYEFLKKCYEDSDFCEEHHEEYNKLMESFYNMSLEKPQTIMCCTDGLSDNLDLPYFYLGMNRDECSEEEYDNAYDLLCENQKIYDKTLRDYIYYTYINPQSVSEVS